MQLDVTRTISGDMEGESGLAVRSNGPLLFSEYVSGIWKNADMSSLCVLLRSSYVPDNGEASMSCSGIFRQGEYTTMRSLGSVLSGETAVNGTGLLLFGSQSNGNRSVSGCGFVSGNMSVHDLVRYGRKL
jgi:hypothetical protein